MAPKVMISLNVLPCHLGCLHLFSYTAYRSALMHVTRRPISSHVWSESMEVMVIDFIYGSVMK